VIGNRKSRVLVLVAVLVLVFLSSLALLLRTQAMAPHIFGVEGYHHIRVARMIRVDGIPGDFPWMQVSLLRSGYADLHLLHHLALAPFAGSDDLQLLEASAKRAAAFYGAVFLTLFTLVLHRLRCPWALFWTAALACGAGGFLLRLAQPRPEVTALLLLVPACWLFARRRRRHWPHLLFGLLFTLTGPTPQLAVCLALLFLLGRRLAGEQPLDWRMPLFTMAGSAAGLLAHPDRLDFARLVARLNWRTLLSGLIPGSGVPPMIQAIENKSPALDTLLLHHELVALPLALLLLILLVRRRSLPAVSGETLSLFLCSTGALALTMTAARHTLLWASFTTLFSALLLRDLLAGPAGTVGVRRRPRTALALLLLLTLAGLRTHGYMSDWLLADTNKAARRQMASVGAILRDEALPGDTVYHTRWIHFPQLFFHAPSQYYLVGLDPMLMLAHGDQYLEIWQDIRQGKLADPYPFIRGLFNSRHLVVARSQEALRRRLGSDPRFRLRYREHSLELYRLRDAAPGFITDWRVAPLTAGPAPRGTGPIFPVPDPDLPLVPYHQSPPPGGIEVGYIGFRPFFPLGPMAPPAALAESVLTLEHAVEGAEIRFGASGPAQLELNGELLLACRDANRMALVDQWRCRVDLPAGENRLRVTATRSTRDWGFFLRVLDGSGRPITSSE